MPFLKCKTKNLPRSRAIDKSAELQGLRALVHKYRQGSYRGFWDRNRKHGYGVLQTNSRRLYEGNWMKDYRHGFGTQANVDEYKVIHLEYRGNWRLGHYSGYGERHYADGGYYKGYMKKSKGHGEGQMWYGDGSFYHGPWVWDKKEVIGLLVYPNGNRYEGVFFEDFKEGKGRFYHLSTGQLQEGFWHKDNCTTSSIEDLPYKQTSMQPTEIPIPKNHINEDGLYIQEEEVMYPLK